MHLADHPGCNPACRACHYKRLDYDEQLKRKQEWAMSNLRAWSTVLRPIIPAPESERLAYRSKSWLRSSFEHGALSFGMYRAIQVSGKWRPEFISWDHCPIHTQPIQEMIGRLREVLAARAPEFSARSLFGVWMGSPHLVLVARDPAAVQLNAIDWNSILRQPFNRVWLHRTSQVGRRIFQNEKFELLSGPPADEEHPIRAFRQVAQSLLVEARKRAISFLLAGDPVLVVDLYCGTGEIARSIPSSVGWLGIEATKSAAEYADELRRSDEVEHVAFTGRVEDRLRDERVLKKITGRYALYVNPPRSGMSREARESLLEVIRSRPPTVIVFLSCSASSLGRDLRRFEGAGYRLELLEPYDFFPQTEHFETLAVLRAGAG